MKAAHSSTAPDFLSDWPQGFLEMLGDLQTADQTLHDLMALEIWSMAQTLDEAFPGLWAQYMENRQRLVHDYLSNRRQPQDSDNGQPSRRIFSVNEAVQTASRLSHWQAATQALTTLSDQDFLVLEPEAAPESLPEMRPEPPQDIRLLPLPHLYRPPVVQVPTSAEATAATVVPVSIACWTTRHFGLGATAQDAAALRSQESVVLKPGDSLACGLGFALQGVRSPLGFRLVDALVNQGLLVESLEVQAAGELVVTLKHHASQPLELQAGKPLGRVEFRSLAVHLRSLRRSYGTRFRNRVPQPAAVSLTA